MFTIRNGPDGKPALSDKGEMVYQCPACAAGGKPHDIVDVSGEPTTESSCWGPGIPSHVRRCTGCGREDGPWVFAKYVCGD
jgi:hypothetical protein